MSFIKAFVSKKEKKMHPSCFDSSLAEQCRAKGILIKKKQKNKTKKNKSRDACF